MKLIYISHWRFPSDKTMSPLIMRTCEEFAKQGAEVELWVPRRYNKQYSGKDPFLHYNIKPIFRIFSLPVIDLMPFIPGALGFALMVFSFGISVFLKGMFMRKQTVWYAHDLRDIALLPRNNIFVEIHDFYESSFAFLNRVALQRVWGLIVTNRIKMERLGKIYGIAQDRMVHLPNAVDFIRFNRSETREEARKKLSLALDKRLVIFTGSLFGWKGIHTLALSSQYLAENVEIIFAGGNENERHDFKRFIDERGLQRISLIPLPYEDMERAPLLMRAADVLALPNTAKDPASKYETSPVKLFEYMASGSPIVASDLPSIRDIVTENEVQFFEPDNEKDLAQAIQYVLNNPIIADEKVKRSSARARQFSWDNRVQSVIAFINSSLVIR